MRNLTKHKVSDGFIITPNDQVSSQIDIIIYKNDESPILENNYIDFFAVESVLAIGEVKSTLDKSSFIKTIQKLAENKRLFKNKNGKCIKKDFKGPEHDELISFLVCRTTSFDINHLDFDEIYKDIEDIYRHNFIIDLEKGLIGYEFSYSTLSTADKELFSKMEGDLNSTIWYEYPIYTFSNTIYNCKPIFHPINSQNKYFHLHIFLTQLTRAIEYKSLYVTDILSYLDLPVAKIFK